MMHRILFVCTGNTCRSPMAEAVARRYLTERGLRESVEVFSRGIAAASGQPASDNAILAMGEQGLNLDSHRSGFLMAEEVARADLILTMTRRHKDLVATLYGGAAEKVFTLAEYAGMPDGDIADPFGGDLETYRRCSQTISEMVDQALDRFVAETGLAPAPAMEAPEAEPTLPGGEE